MPKSTKPAKHTPAPFHYHLYRRGQLADKGMRLGEVIWAYEGLQIKCDGAEGAFLTLRLPDGKTKQLAKATAKTLFHALSNGIEWCEYGEPPGMQ